MSPLTLLLCVEAVAAAILGWPFVAEGALAAALTLEYLRARQ